jgi:magnesium-transporting ATPase (P-type)
MKIPADCMLFEGTNIQCNETDLTGEPDDLEKFAINEDNYQNGKNPCLL